MRLGYRPALDGLRTVAILLVGLHHFGLPGLHGGAVGVDLFFVLSGFLITSLLLEEWEDARSISLPRFYARRALRLLPALAPVLLVSGLWASAHPADPRSGPTLAEIPYAVAYVLNWYHADPSTPYGILSHLWSLSIEEQFYLAWPLLLLGLLRCGLGRGAVAGLLLALVVAIAVNRYGMLMGLSHLRPIYYGFHTRADLLALGAVTALLAPSILAQGHRLRSAALSLAPYLLGAFLLAVLALAETVDPEGVTLRAGGWTVLGALAGATLLHLVHCPSLVARALSWPPLAGIGRISYGLYLWHFPVAEMVRPDWPDAPLLLLRAGLTLAVTLASWHLVERPALRLKARWGAHQEITSRKAIPTTAAGEIVPMA